MNAPNPASKKFSRKVSRDTRAAELLKYALFNERKIMLTTTFDQRLEPLKEASFFFRPLDEATETFLVNGPFVDLAIRSTWA
jgi:hypothetical protein